ncbi:MAG: diadenylate cyclase CdaA [Deltaproteobacteria bacterium]
MGINNIFDVLRVTIDISIVSFVIYWLIVLVKDTRAYQLIKGIIVLLVATQLSELLKLTTINYILKNTMTYGVLALLVVFQPELRRALEQLGRSKFKDIFVVDEETKEDKLRKAIDEIIRSVDVLSKTFTGALIVIERDTMMGDIIRTGIPVNATITAELIVNIFTPNTPLHDGAVVVREDKIMSAACFLPLTENHDLSKELGTRHRAALGISEVTDSIAVVVSEESGKISMAINGGLTRNLSVDTLKMALDKFFIDKKYTPKKLMLWKVKKNEKAR